MAAFTVSACVTAHHRPAQKPFNPILGETYMYDVIFFKHACGSVSQSDMCGICILHHLYAELLGREMTTIEV